MREGLGGKMKNNKRQNILLLALSTFFSRNDEKPDLTKTYEYFYMDSKNSHSGKYIYQMEPVVQVLSKKLADENDTLDAIVMLCSKQSMEKKMVIDNQGERSVSPLDFFKEKTVPWLNSDRDIEDMFYPIRMDENDSSGGIADAVNLLRKLNEKGMSLYLDNHGGFRGTQQALEAILSLLKIESIQITEVFNVKFSGSRSEISSNDMEFRMFDFVSGINEFINYGRIDSLKNYFDRVGKDEETEELLSIISGIAEAIQLCDVMGFEENLDKLSKFFSSHGRPRNNYLALFYQNIENDYKSLIKVRHDTLDEVEWCLKKGFYQQCLTLIEGKMPRELGINGVMKWGKSLDNYAEQSHGHFEKNVYVFNYIMGAPLFYFKYEKNVFKSTEDVEEKLCELIRNCNSGGAYLREIDSWKLAWKIDKMFFVVRKEDKKEKYPVYFQYQDRNKLYDFLVLHKALKIMRNRSNHAVEKETGIPIANVKAAIEIYISLGRDILKYGIENRR